MDFSVNSWVLFVLVGIIIATVLGQSVYFLVRALRRARELGIAPSVVRKTISSSAVFTVAPAVSILVSVVALSKTLGVALPWLRLSVIGSMSYEVVASQNVIEAANLDSGAAITDPSIFLSVVWVMTLSIAAGLVLVPFMTKSIQSGMTRMSLRDKKWGEIFNNAMFLGMISAFLGFVFCDVSLIVEGNTACLIAPLVMFTSALIMVVCGLLATRCRVRWLTDYALPLSLVGGMAAAVPLTGWLG
ncbi:MAG: DUF5058 family protein [Ruminococcaceae bacterium]|nr:DUF5058 family protein [Oscillospiraceae bacterium]